MCCTCFWTVRGLHSRIFPISWFRFPATIHSTTSSSRCVKYGGSVSATRRLLDLPCRRPFREGIARLLLAERDGFVHTHNSVCSGMVKKSSRAEEKAQSIPAEDRIGSAGLRGRTGEPSLDFVGVLFVEGVGEFAERMANHHPETFPIQVGDAMLERSAVDVEGGGEIALHAKNGVTHQTHPAAARGSFGDVG